MEIRFKKAAAGNAYDIAALAAKMWTSHTVEELAEGFAAAINDPDGAVFLMTDSDKAVGFARRFSRSKQDHLFCEEDLIE